MTRTLVVGHDAVAGLGCLDLGEVEWFTALPDVDVVFPDPTPYDRVVVLGAPWPGSAFGWIDRERHFLTTGCDAPPHTTPPQPRRPRHACSPRCWNDERAARHR